MCRLQIRLRLTECVCYVGYIISKRSFAESSRLTSFIEVTTRLEVSTIPCKLTSIKIALACQLWQWIYDLVAFLSNLHQSMSADADVLSVNCSLFCDQESAPKYPASTNAPRPNADRQIELMDRHLIPPRLDIESGA